MIRIAQLVVMILLLIVAVLTYLHIRKHIKKADCGCGGEMHDADEVDKFATDVASLIKSKLGTAATSAEATIREQLGVKPAPVDNNYAPM